MKDTKTRDEKKDVLIAACIALLNIDGFDGFTPEEAAKVKHGLDHAIKGGVNDIYNSDKELDYIMDITAKAMEKIAIDVGVMDEDGNKIVKKPTGQGPIWS